MSTSRKIALLGNPNCGKTSIFNHLTGLNQKVGNFTGVTTARYSGFFQSEGHYYEIVDLPGTYSLYARTEDEQVVLTSLLGGEDFFALVLVVDANNLRRSMLLLTQLWDLGLPIVVALNMIDEAFRAGLRIDTISLSKQLRLPIVSTNARKGEGISDLRTTLNQLRSPEGAPFLPAADLPAAEVVSKVKQALHLPNAYWAHLYLQQGSKLRLSSKAATTLHQISTDSNYLPLKAQREELDKRHQYLSNKLLQILPTVGQKHLHLTDKLDKILTHGVYGTIVFLLLLLLIFQAIFAWSEPLMNTIDSAFGWTKSSLSRILPPSIWTNLLTDGVLTGIGGVVIFVPQIAFLFFTYRSVGRVRLYGTSCHTF